jgi:hypothetical protein
MKDLLHFLKSENRISLEDKILIELIAKLLNPTVSAGVVSLEDEIICHSSDTLRFTRTLRMIESCEKQVST